MELAQIGKMIQWMHTPSTEEIYSLIDRSIWVQHDEKQGNQFLAKRLVFSAYLVIG